MYPLPNRRLSYKSTGLQPTRRLKRISYKSTKSWTQYGHAIKERLQIKASFKPTLNATRGLPKLAALEHVNTVMQTFRTHVKPPYLRAVSRIDGMQDTIIAHCEALTLIFYSIKKRKKIKRIHHNLRFRSPSICSAQCVYVKPTASFLVV